MQKKSNTLRVLTRALMLTCVLCLADMVKAQPQPPSLATVQTLTGQLEVQRSGATTALLLAERSGLFASDVVSTGLDSKAGLLFNDGSRLLLNANTIVELTTPAPVGSGPVGKGNPSLFRLAQGAGAARARPG